MQDGSTTTTTRILVVANRTAATPRLLEEVRRRAEEGSCRFTLLVPDASSRKAADWTLENAIPLLRRAARSKVEGMAGGPEPFEAVEQAVRDGDFDEIIVSTLSKKRSAWLRRDLVRRIEALGLPVTAVMPRERGRTSTLEAVASTPGAGGGAIG
jgi:hypothetical protein